MEQKRVAPFLVQLLESVHARATLCMRVAFLFLAAAVRGRKGGSADGHVPIYICTDFRRDLRSHLNRNVLLIQKQHAYVLIPNRRPYVQSHSDPASDLHPIALGPLHSIALRHVLAGSGPDKLYTRAFGQEHA